MKTEIERFRTRWKRWLGNKTRANHPYWTTLLDSNWLGWCETVLGECQPEYTHHSLNYLSSREEVKMLFSRAIESATMRHLQKLDALCAEDRWVK